MMKKKILLPVCAMTLALALAACGTTAAEETADTTETEETAAVETTEAEETAEETAEDTADKSEMTTEDDGAAAEELTNPVVEYETLDEINSIIGSNLAAPDGEVTDEAFAVIGDTIAEYDFTLDGIPYAFRASQDTENDISGVYSGDGLLLDSMDADGYAADDTGKIITWCLTWEDTGSVQYVLYAADEGALTEDAFKEFAYTMQDKTVGVVSDEEFGAQIYPELEGTYYDETSQRATMDIVNNGDSVTITVSWADSASTCEVWTMTATFSSTWGLPYSDCVEKTVTCNEDGSVASEDIVAENVEGYFAIDGQMNLYWYGAAAENCQSCVFVKDTSQAE